MGRSATSHLPVLVMVMGVSGAGKTTVGRALAARLGIAFQDGDALHPPENVAKMTGGMPLRDDDRRPWLAAVAAWIHRQRGTGAGGVVACSALKRAYRRAIVGDHADVRLVHLRGDRDLLAARLLARTGHFMPASLLDSQLDALEEPDADERPIVVDVAAPVTELVAAIVRGLRVQD